VRRGFKTEAERLAQSVRERQGLRPNQPVSLEQAAKEMGVRIVAADELVDRARLEELEELQSGAFSAATFRIPGGGYVIVYSPLSLVGRRRSDQAHELAHIILDHEVRTVERVGTMQFLTCDVEQEEEANWLGGCLLLPRPLLLKAAKEGLSSSEIAELYEVSEPMARFRLNASGVLVQVGRERALRRKNAAG
jgi:hypothetical protein